MKTSNHAMIRCQQRGFKRNLVPYILEHGEPKRKVGNAFEYRITRKEKNEIISEFKKVIQLMDNIENKAILVSEEGDTVITIYNIN